MCDNLKALLAKVWRDKVLDLSPGRHYFDETVTVRVSGAVERQNDQLVAPTTSIPMLTVIALFWQRCGVTRDDAMAALRESLIEAMQEGVDKEEKIKSHIKDCEATVQAVKEQLISRLPKVPRSGRLVTKDLRVEVLSVAEEQEALVPAA